MMNADAGAAELGGYRETEADNAALMAAQITIYGSGWKAAVEATAP